MLLLLLVWGGRSEACEGGAVLSPSGERGVPCWSLSVGGKGNGKCYVNYIEDFFALLSAERCSSRHQRYVVLGVL